MNHVRSHTSAGEAAGNVPFDSLGSHMRDEKSPSATDTVSDKFIMINSS